MEEKLRAGATVADLGCGYGASTIIMTQKYPNSMFVEFSYHEVSVAGACKAATEVGVDDRYSFEVASATDYPGTDYVPPMSQKVCRCRAALHLYV